MNDWPVDMAFALESELPRAMRVSADAYEGHFDAIADGVALGWVRPTEPGGAPVRVELWADGEVLALGFAEGYRADLEAAGKGDGRHAFRIPLPRGLAPGRVYSVSARAAGQADPLPGGPLAYAPQARGSVVIVGFAGSALVCRVEAPERAPERVSLRLDGDLVVSAAVPRRREGERGEFAIEVPPRWLDGRAAWAQLTPEGGGEALHDTALLLPGLATPEEALRRHARDFPAHLSAAAGLRLASLRGHVALGAAGGEGISAAECEQLARAYHAVQMGFEAQDLARGPLRFPEVEEPLVSVVVPVRDRFEVTYNCLAALLLAPNRASFEVVLVDDGSTDRTAAIGALVRGLRIVRRAVNRGFVHSCNEGARAARGRYVVMLNNDTEAGPFWLDEMLRVFDDMPEAGLVGARLLYPDGRLQEAGGMIFRDGCWNYGRDGNPLDPAYGFVRDADYVSGAAIMMPRDLWERLGGFDEDYAPAYCEDADLAMRVRAAGRRVIYTPFAQVIHFEGRSNGLSLDEGVKRYQRVNEGRFRGRWAHELRTRPKAPDVAAARDRGFLFRVLAIDAETPQPDRGAGGHAAVQEFRLLQSLGARVTFAPENLAYLGNYTEALQRGGVECLYAPFCASIGELIAERGHEFDVFYITRYRVAARHVAAIRRHAPGARIVFCNADLHFLREIRAALAGRDPGAMAAAVATRDAELELIRQVDLTLTYSDAEAAVILSHTLGAGRVARAPWVVEAGGRKAGFAARADIAFLGGFAHPPNRDAVAFFVAEVMPALRRRLPGVRLRIYGAQVPADLAALGAPDVVFEGYVADVAEVYDTARVFVAPLRAGAGIKGKVIGALAAGVPAVVSEVAAEGIGLADGREALVAATVADWVDAIARLYRDKALWTRMSDNAVSFARGQFSFAAGRRRMRAALATIGIHAAEEGEAG